MLVHCGRRCDISVRVCWLPTVMSCLVSALTASILSFRTPQTKLRIARAVFDRCGSADLESEPFRRFCSDAWEWLQV